MALGSPFPPPAGTCSCGGAMARLVLREDGTGTAPAPRAAATEPNPAHGRDGEGPGQRMLLCPWWPRDAAWGRACRCCSSSLAAGRAPRRGGHLLVLFSLPPAPQAGGVASIFPRVQGGQRLFPTVPIGPHLPQIASTRETALSAAPGPAVSSSLGRDVPILFGFIHPSATDPGGRFGSALLGTPRRSACKCRCPLRERQNWGSQQQLEPHLCPPVGLGSLQGRAGLLPPWPQLWLVLCLSPGVSHPRERPPMGEGGTGPPDRVTRSTRRRLLGGGSSPDPEVTQKSNKHRNTPRPPPGRAVCHTAWQDVTVALAALRSGCVRTPCSLAPAGHPQAGRGAAPAVSPPGARGTGGGQGRCGFRGSQPHSAPSPRGAAEDPGAFLVKTALGQSQLTFIFSPNKKLIKEKMKK